MKPSESPYQNLSYKQRQLPIEMQELIENTRKEKGGFYYINFEGKEVFCATGDLNYSSAIYSATKFISPDGKITLMDDNSWPPNAASAPTNKNHGTPPVPISPRAIVQF